MGWLSPFSYSLPALSADELLAVLFSASKVLEPLSRCSFTFMGSYASMTEFSSALCMLPVQLTNKHPDHRQWIHLYRYQYSTM